MALSPLSYDNANNYPRNVVGCTLAPYTIDAISNQLNAQADRLFTAEAHAALDFLELEENAEGIVHVFPQ